MRYYKIVITPTGSDTSTTSGTTTTVSGRKSLTFTTHPNGLQSAPDMGAMHVQFDLPVSSFDSPNGSFYLEIRGVDMATISQASNLQGSQVKIYGGMGKGYPLAKPDQAGLLVVGSVFQAFGNWMNTEMSLNLLIQPFSTPLDQTNYPKLVWHWKKGQSIKDAIQQTFANGMSSYSLDFSGVNTDLTAGSDDVGFYGDVSSLAQNIQNISLAANPDDSYQGIRFFIRGNTFYFYDGSSDASPKEIQFEDMIGQPTWIGPDPLPTIMLQTVMRADITIGDVIKMPAFNQNGSNQTLSGYGMMAPTQQSGQTPKNRALFQGNFMITEMRHIGDSRNPDGGAWVTVFKAVKT